jgi:hypothetical protein
MVSIVTGACGWDATVADGAGGGAAGGVAQPARAAASKRQAVRMGVSVVFQQRKAAR